MFVFEETVIAELRLKTGFWQTLPWKICGIGADDPEVARACVRQALQLFAEHRPGWNHPISRRFFDPATWLEQGDLNSHEPHGHGSYVSVAH